MPLQIAVLLGIVEGLTEYLPVSSTGHLVLAGHVLGLPDDDPATSSFEIVVQLGAILAVVVHYRTLLAERLRGLFSGDPAAARLLAAIAIAFAPAAAAGLLFRKAIKAHLFGPLPVALALAIGGAAMIAVERFLRGRKQTAVAPPQGRADAMGGVSGPPPVHPRPAHALDGASAAPAAARSKLGEGLDQVTPARALAIGLGQCLSLWPGASRAMCTIVAGQLSGLTTATAAEFSFLLALPTLGAATLFEASKARHTLAVSVGGLSMAIGLVVSFLVAWGVIATFLKYLRTRGLEPFGWYRIALGVVVLWALYR
jgi:undecaprenyl-diphosphatase